MLQDFCLFSWQLRQKLHACSSLQNPQSVLCERERDQGRQAGRQAGSPDKRVRSERTRASLANWLQGTYVFLPCQIVIANRRNQQKQRLPY